LQISDLNTSNDVAEIDLEEGFVVADVFSVNG